MVIASTQIDSEPMQRLVAFGNAVERLDSNNSDSGTCCTEATEGGSDIAALAHSCKRRHMFDIMVYCGPVTTTWRRTVPRACEVFRGQFCVS